MYICRIGKSGFDTLYRHVKKVVDILRNINFRGKWQNSMKKGDVVARYEKMGIYERYWCFL